MLIWLFVSFAVIILVLDLVYIIGDEEDQNTGDVPDIIWHILPCIEALVIVSALVVALWKLRGFHLKYKISVNLTKIKIHFAICMELLLIFVSRFFRSLKFAKITSNSFSTEPTALENIYNEVQGIFCW